MNTKLMTSAGCLLLLAAAIAPSVLGHEERGAFGTAGTAGVSGRYVGAAGPASADETDYPNTIAAGQALCDVEVAGDGTTPFPQDEISVDGAAGGLVTDTNDDGGFGAACHTRTYLHTPYNTPGCPAATAKASNAVSGVDGGPFIGASCDWKTVVGGTPSSSIFLTCVVNSLIQGQPLNVVVCLTTFLDCLGDPTGCTADGNEFCGGDNVSDGINYGHGTVGVAYPTASAHQGDAFPDLDFNRDGTVDGACATADASAVTFVFDAVNTNHLDTAGGSPAVHPALTGEIWQE